MDLLANPKILVSDESIERSFLLDVAAALEKTSAKFVALFDVRFFRC